MSYRPCIIDYLSFTWCPEALVPLRKLAQHDAEYRRKQKEAYDNANYSEILWLDEEHGQALTAVNLNKMDLQCFDELKRFFAETNVWYGKHVEISERDRGLFGYKKSWTIHVEGSPVGVAAAGAKNGGCYISLTGAGCEGIQPEKMAKQIQLLPYWKITRVDIAYDDYEGEYTVEEMKRRYIDRQFSAGGRAPKYQYYEGGVLDDSGKLDKSGGCSFYVGSRQSGKLFRAYEKGKQLLGRGGVLREGQENWVRHELELRSTDRVIPISILTEPAKYLHSAYPALDFIATADEVPSCRIETKKRKAKIATTNLIVHARRSYGGLLNVMRQTLDLTDSEIVDLLISKRTDAVPRPLIRAMGIDQPI